MGNEKIVGKLESAFANLRRISACISDGGPADGFARDEKVRDAIPLFSVMPYSGGYRVWCPPGTSIPYNLGVYPISGADNDGWVNLGNARGDVYAFVRSESDCMAEIGTSLPDNVAYSVRIARIN